jgi:hypothetical protein
VLPGSDPSFLRGPAGNNRPDRADPLILLVIFVSR